MTSPQPNWYDCGAYIIAYSYALLNGDQPHQIIFNDSDRLRRLLDLKTSDPNYQLDDSLVLRTSSIMINFNNN